MVAPSLRFLEFQTTILSDALEKEGQAGGLGNWIAINGPFRIAGRVVTVRLEPGASPPSAVHLGARAIRAAHPGDILVIANRGRTEAAAWGALLSLAASKRGVAGVIVDGLLRDADEVRKIGLPVLARGVTPRSARGRFVEAETNGPVRVGDVRVNAGDMALADASGVVFIPKHLEGAVLETAARISAFEAASERDLASGKDPNLVLDERYERLTGK